MVSSLYFKDKPGSVDIANRTTLEEMNEEPNPASRLSTISVKFSLVLCCYLDHTSSTFVCECTVCRQNTAGLQNAEVQEADLWDPEVSLARVFEDSVLYLAVAV